MKVRNVLLSIVFILMLVVIGKIVNIEMKKDAALGAVIEGIKTNPVDNFHVNGNIENFKVETEEGTYRVFTVTSLKGVGITAIKIGE